MASARWRCVQCSDSRSFGVIEKLCVLEGYRLRGIGKLLLRNLFQDIAGTSSQTGVMGISFVIPKDDTLLVQLLDKMNSRESLVIETQDGDTNIYASKLLS